MAKIICGFAGTGKSNIARNNVGFVDLESTPFEKDWNRYVKVAEYLSNNGYTVLLSCHKELREELRSKSIASEMKFFNIIKCIKN